MWDMPLPLLAPVGVLAPPVVPIAAGSVSNVATFDIPFGPQDFERVDILFDQWAPVSTSVAQFRTSSDGGSTFDSGASDYRNSGVQHEPAGTTSGFTNALSFAQFGHDTGNGRMLGGTTLSCFLLTLFDPTSTGSRTYYEAWGGWDRNVVSNSMQAINTGYRDTTGRVDAVRMLASTGNVSARYFAWGLLSL